MGNEKIKIRCVDSVEVFSVMDNSVDFLSTTQRKEVKRFRDWMGNRIGNETNKKIIELPFAEHGFSMLVRVFSDGDDYSILFDTGMSSLGAKINADRMGLDISEIECIVLSHGHYDHFGGLLSILNSIGKRCLPVIVHDHMFRIRRVMNQNGTFREYPLFPNIEDNPYGEYVKSERAHLVADNRILVMGEIPRKTDFEVGLPRHQSFVENDWKADPWILDDRAIIVHLEGKGLLVISGCAHAGIINTVLNARDITGIKKIHAIIGGFHLVGRNCEPRIEATLDHLISLNPDILVPSHCTGWKGISRIAYAMPQAFIWNSVGNRYKF
jgi:7,8-dihydropterin-6-yl-methyl-4-(beta-D-ribofuranosyl)aminobenzene 5'-phosphate synthase